MDRLSPARNCALTMHGTRPILHEFQQFDARQRTHLLEWMDGTLKSQFINCYWGLCLMEVATRSECQLNLAFFFYCPTVASASRRSSQCRRVGEVFLWENRRASFTKLSPPWNGSCTILDGSNLFWLKRIESPSPSACCCPLPSFA